MKNLRKIISFCIVLCAITSLTSCVAKGNKRFEKEYFGLFDTFSFVYSYKNESRAMFEKNAENVYNTLDKYHKLLDIYNEYDGINNLCTLNKNAGIKEVKVEKELVDFCVFAKEIYEKTNKETNVMMGSVLSLWHKCREQGEKIPSKEELKNASLYCDFSYLQINEKENTLFISDNKASIDVGAIGKGYAVEMAARSLENKGVSGYVINVGGNIRMIGKKDGGNGWSTGIKDPFNTSDIKLSLDLSDTSCVTSGSYERYYTVDGEKYHHIIDKDTLLPSKHFPSVTVITKDSGLADALSTALFCTSYEDGLSIVNNFENVGVVWITHDGKILYTDNLSKLINEQ